MTIKPGIVAALVAAVALAPLAASAHSFSAAAAGPLAVLPVVSGQAFTSATSPGGMAGASATPAAESSAEPAAETGAQTHSNLASNDPASKLCAEGTRAIDQGRWADAVKIFTQVAGQHGDHADAALYWKAYAENKLGQSKPSQSSCADLRSSYPKSKWIEDCGALEVEIQAKRGEKVRIEPGQSDDVKLLALNAMMRQNEPEALAEIQEILSGDSSEKLKKEAEFILGHHYSDATYAQIVRISYVDGDVRIQRGEPTGKPGSAIWENAAPNLAISTGFSLATGEGRAEIEFENASTIYLGPNSVLTFNDLHETAGVPFTEMALLSGTVSLYFHPYTPWEKLILHTPTNDLVTRFPDKTYARVEAYTDAVSITPLPGGDVRLPGIARDAVVPGRTFTWLQGQLLDAQTPAGQKALAARDADKETMAAWDKWTADRIAHRNAAIASVMEASGLSAPIPGMADMAGQGKFFDCAPYGTCWEPSDEAAQDEKAANQKSFLRPGDRLNPRTESRPHLALASYSPAGAANGAGQWTDPDLMDLEARFPCTPMSVINRMMRLAAVGQVSPIGGSYFETAPYDWAVCHAGSWIRHRRHYVWVAGSKRHHTPPVRWVKGDRRVGFVPLHPYDVKGRPAINAKLGFFAAGGKNGVILEPVKPDPAHPVQFLKEPPKEFRTEPLRPLTVAEIPRMEAHAFPVAGPGKGVEVARAGVPIHFDPRTQSFMLPRQQTIGGRTTTAFAPMTNHSGSLQAHGGSFPGSSGFRGGSSGGTSGFSGGSRGSSAGASSSAGSHGSFSSGGSVSTSSSAGATAAASSSAAHH